MLAKTTSMPLSWSSNSASVSGPYFGGCTSSQPAPVSSSSARLPTDSTLSVRAVIRTFHDMGVECGAGGPKRKTEKPDGLDGGRISFLQSQSDLRKAQSTRSPLPDWTGRGQEDLLALDQIRTCR